MNARELLIFLCGVFFPFAVRGLARARSRWKYDRAERVALQIAEVIDNAPKPKRKYKPRAPKVADILAATGMEPPGERINRERVEKWEAQQTEEPLSAESKAKFAPLPPPKLMEWDPAWDNTDLYNRARDNGRPDLCERMNGETPYDRRPAFKEAYELFLAGKLACTPELLAEAERERAERERAELTPLEQAIEGAAAEGSS